MVRPTTRALRKFDASTSADGGTPGGISMIRFSTMPASVTMTTSARPGLRLTTSMCFSAASVFGAMTMPAHRDSPESAAVACSSRPSMLMPEPAQRSESVRRSSSGRWPTSSRPSTNSLSPASVGSRPAEACGANRSPVSSRSAITLRMVAGDSESDSRRDNVREPTGSPVSR